MDIKSIALLQNNYNKYFGNLYVNNMEEFIYGNTCSKKVYQGF